MNKSDSKKDDAPTQDEALEGGVPLDKLLFENAVVRGSVFERRPTEGSSHDIEKFYQEIFEASPAPELFVDPESGCIVAANSAACEFYGYSPEELRALHLWDINMLSEAMTRERLVRAHSIQRLEFDVHHRLANGVVRDVRVFSGHVKAGGRTLLQAIILDVTEHKRAEVALRESQRTLQSILDNTPLLVYVKDLNGRHTLVNRQFESLFGMSREQLLGRTSDEFVSKPDAYAHRANDRAVIESRDIVVVEETNEQADGTHVYLSTKFPLFDVAGEMTGVCGISADITERRRAEEERAKLESQLQQSQKMEAVGRLAGGVAHDFNNMLGAILGNVDMAMEELGPMHPVHANLKEIQAVARRSVDLTHQLLAFARKQTVLPQVLDLNQTVEGMSKMLGRIIGENIQFTFKPGADLWAVRIDPSQVDQILTNLCVNAGDAIGDVGKITIETNNSQVDADYCADHPECTVGDYVQLTVSDTGHGMDKPTLARLFEPFFTTKPVGKGTGLGLATVYGSVTQNAGFINVYSELGHGTTFEIYLPRYMGEGRRLTPPPTMSLPKGNETILIVEDEPSILKMAKKMLERQGYRVIVAGTPGEAIRLATEHSEEIHLVMTDVVMPEMNGRDLANRLVSLFPRLKCLFMSGYPADVIARRGILDEGVHFIQKPFSKEELGAIVREVLAREPASPAV